MTDAEVVTRLVTLLVAQREAARQRRDFVAADTIRDVLAECGVRVTDGPDGAPRVYAEARWDARDATIRALRAEVRRMGETNARLVSENCTLLTATLMSRSGPCTS